MEDKTLLKITAPFKCEARTVTSDMIRKAIDLLANTPDGFKSMDLVSTMFPDSDATFWHKQEALNRLFQRWRKAGLVSFQKGRWSLSRGAWDTMQSASRLSREAEREAAST